MVYFYLLFSQFLELLCYSLLRGVKVHYSPTFYAVSLRDDLAFLFLQLIVVIKMKEAEGKAFIACSLLTCCGFQKGYFCR